MKRQTENKILLVVRPTRLEGLKRRFNTIAAAKFYVSHMGSDYSDYEREDECYHRRREAALAALSELGRVQQLSREFLPNFVFSPEDTVVVLGQDGLVANTMKYLEAQPVIGVNPDPERWDGVLLPFKVEDLPKIVPEVFHRRRPMKLVTMARADLGDGQTLHGVNDLFIGLRGHASARYEIAIGSACEEQSSSGVIVSTGLGSTGWLKSILAGAMGIAGNIGGKRAAAPAPQPIPWDAKQLVFTVREPYPSRSTQANLIFGRIAADQTLRLTSKMAENGVIFSDGIESDCLTFNAGMQATIRVAEKIGCLVV